MRRGQRYLLLRISGFSGSPEETEKALRAEMEKVLGTASLGRTGYVFVREREEGRMKGALGRGESIIKGSIGGVSAIRAAITLLSSLNEKRAKCEVLKTSGTIKGLLSN